MGSVYFCGVLSTILIVPYLTDKHGRKYSAVISNFLLIFVTIGIIFARDITALYILLFLAGATFAGRVIAGLNWLLEYNILQNREFVMFVKLIFSAVSIILITLAFNFISDP